MSLEGKGLKINSFILQNLNLQTHPKKEGIENMNFFFNEIVQYILGRYSSIINSSNIINAFLHKSNNIKTHNLK